MWVAGRCLAKGGATPFRRRQGRSAALRVPAGRPCGPALTPSPGCGEGASKEATQGRRFAVGVGEGFEQVVGDAGDGLALPQRLAYQVFHSVEASGGPSLENTAPQGDRAVFEVHTVASPTRSSFSRGNNTRPRFP